MWKLVYGSVRGTSHARSGQPCQDYCTGRAVDSIMIAACSDGAGSASLSHLGSRLAVECFVEAATQSQDGSPPDRATIESWVELSRRQVLDEASAQGVIPRQLACTFLGAIVGEDWAVFAQIGDGVIVFDGESDYEMAFWPDNGEYANATRFLTDDDYLDHLRIETVARRISDLAILTDGMQTLALDFAAARVHRPFFTPLFQTVRNGPNVATLQTSLLGFMDSKRINDRTDDDKTLFLATRMVPDVPSSLSDATA